MPLSLVFRKSDKIPIEFKSVSSESPYLRLYHSYLEDQKALYNMLNTANYTKIIFQEKGLAPADVKLCFEVDEEYCKKDLVVEINNRLISQKIPIQNDLDIYRAEASCDDGILEITIPKI